MANIFSKLLFCLILHRSLSALALVFVHIGPTLPNYTEDALHQARLFNPSCPIYLVASQEALGALTPRSHMDRIHAYPLENLLKTDKHKAFEAASTLDRGFREGFWRFTTERFFVIEELMLQENLRDVFHLENDVMLYADLAPMLPLFQTHYKTIGATFDNDERCIPGFIYFADVQALGALTCFIQEHARSGHNDMQSLANFKKVQGNKIEQLPIVMGNYFHHFPAQSAAGHRVENSALFAQHWEVFESIFDAAALGQCLGGQDPRNGKKKKGAFINESCIFNPGHLAYEWIRDEKGRKVPYAHFAGVRCRINNLHIHSKNLKPFASD